MGPSLLWWYIFIAMVSFGMRAMIPRDLLKQHFRLFPDRARRAFRGAKATGQRGHERAESLVWAELRRVAWWGPLRRRWLWSVGWLSRCEQARPLAVVVVLRVGYVVRVFLLVTDSLPVHPTSTPPPLLSQPHFTLQLLLLATIQLDSLLPPLRHLHVSKHSLLLRLKRRSDSRPAALGPALELPHTTPKAEAKACCAQPAVIRPDYCVSACAHHPPHYSYTARHIDFLLSSPLTSPSPTNNTSIPPSCPTNTPMLSLRRPSRTLARPSQSHSSTALLVSV